ncbi:hypothetical protein [Pseudomonas syringae pv. coryli]|uniref:hypothetical protein n=1 Tax=Pseudomonas syringae pv. coryli TaxID=317659 RepID=UPI001F320B4B|nr:hypothetical protein [Pseudomonas syringae pv. coryli]
MKDRHDYFTGEGKLWFDNQTDIASACGCSLTAAKALIPKLRQHGYLTVEKRRIHGCAYSNSMTITRDLILASVSPLEAIPKPVAAHQTQEANVCLSTPLLPCHKRPRLHRRPALWRTTNTSKISRNG